jgi:PleD family two-component response regulator
MPIELGDVRVTLSIGVASAAASFVGDGAALMRAADDALYRSKQTGRNRSTLAEPPGP